MDVLHHWKMSPMQLNALFAQWMTAPHLVHLSAAEHVLLTEQWESTYHHQIALCVVEALAPQVRRVLLDAVAHGHIADVEALLWAHASVVGAAITQQTLQFVRMHSPRCPMQSPALRQVGALAESSAV